MAEHGDGKLIPPEPVLVEDLAVRIEQKVRANITERILCEARVDDQVAAAMAAIKMPDGSELKAGVEDLFERERKQNWRDQIEVVSMKLLEPDK